MHPNFHSLVAYSLFCVVVALIIYISILKYLIQNVKGRLCNYVMNLKGVNAKRRKLIKCVLHLLCIRRKVVSRFNGSSEIIILVVGYVIWRWHPFFA